MKKCAIIGLVLAAFIFASCGKTGGTIEVENTSGEYTAKITISKGWIPLKTVKNGFVEPKQTGSFHLDEDDFYHLDVDFINDYGNTRFGPLITPQYVAGGDTVKITVTPR